MTFDSDSALFLSLCIGTGFLLPLGVTVLVFQRSRINRDLPYLAGMLVLKIYAALVSAVILAALTQGTVPALLVLPDAVLLAWIVQVHWNLFARRSTRIRAVVLVMLDAVRWIISYGYFIHGINTNVQLELDHPAILAAIVFPALFALAGLVLTRRTTQPEHP